MDESIRKKYTVVLMLFFNLGQLANAIFFWLLGQWRLVLVLFFLLSYLVSLFLTFFFVEHSPLDLIARCTPE